MNTCYMFLGFSHTTHLIRYEQDVSFSHLFGFLVKGSKKREEGRCNSTGANQHTSRLEVVDTASPGYKVSISLVPFTQWTVKLL